MNKIVINDYYGGFGVSKEAVQWMIDNGLEEQYYYTINNTNVHLSNFEIPRHHPLLVQAVEKFGEQADGLCSSLKVVEIEGNRYRITQYDGWESVETPEDIEWITI